MQREKGSIDFPMRVIEDMCSASGGIHVMKNLMDQNQHIMNSSKAI